MSWGVATQNGVSVSLASIVSISCGATEFSPASLFTSGVQGAWYDPSDYTSLFQDSAGTTAVTAVEQPVGLMLDKSGNSNHASQATAASRPVLRARYNLFTYSEQFDNAGWSKSTNTSITANATTAPDGTTTADILTATIGVGATPYIYQTFTLSATNYRFSVYAKPNGKNWVFLSPTQGSNVGVWFDVSNGVVGTQSSGYTGTIEAAANGFYRCTVAFTGTAVVWFMVVWAVASDGSLAAYTGTTTNGLFIWGADLRTGSSAGTYQRIAAATDYATAGFLPYLALTTDDSFGTGSIDFTATNNMFVCAGVTKLNNVFSVIAELSANFSTNAGAMLLFVNSGDVYGYVTSGTVVPTAILSTGDVSPITSVLSGSSSISTPLMTFRKNATAVSSSSASQGTGNFGNWPLYIGRRNNASDPFEGRIYQMVVCGKTLSASELASTEAFVNQKTGAY